MKNQNLLVSDQISDEEERAVSVIDCWKNTVYRQPVLSAEEENRLALRWFDEQDVDAAKQLVFSHARMVLPVARAYRGYGLPEEDLIQQGNVGLVVRSIKPFTIHFCKRNGLPKRTTSTLTLAGQRFAQDTCTSLRQSVYKKFVSLLAKRRTSQSGQ